MIVGTFGHIAFEVSDSRLYVVGEVARTTGARYEEHLVTGGKPRLEFMAPNLDDITLEIKLQAGYGVNPAAEINKLRTICQSGEAYPLMIGGDNLGRFVIVEISDNWKHSLGDGRVTVLEGSVKFKEYQ